MYNANKAPKHVSEVQMNRESFRLPQLISGLARNLLNADDSNSQQVQKVLKNLYSKAKYDPTLLEVYQSLGWNEDTRMLDENVKVEDVKKKLEEVYDFSFEDLREQEKEKEVRKYVEVGDTSAIGNNPQLILANNNSNMSFYNSNKNDSSLDPFSIYRQVPLGSQGDRNLNQMNYDAHLQFDQIFLTNSAKAWNNSQNIEESSLGTNWQKTSSGKYPNKTPSFHHEENNYNNPSAEDSGMVKSSNSNANFINYNPSPSHLATPIPRKLNYQGLIDQINSPNQAFKKYSNTSNFPPYGFLHKNYSNSVYPFNFQNSPHISNFKIDYTDRNPRRKSANINNFNCNNINSSGENNFKLKQKNPQKTLTRREKEKEKTTSKRGKVSKRTNKVGKKLKLSNKRNVLKDSEGQSRLGYGKAAKLASNAQASTRSSNFGLKEISKKVKDIVRKFKKTSYKQISDIIVSEINEKDSKDEKNIRRRIYDSLNVMKAMNLFKKDSTNKYILWNGTDESFSDGDYESEENQGDSVYLGKNRIKSHNFSFKKKKRYRDDEEDHESLNELKNAIEFKKQELHQKNMTMSVLSEQLQILCDLLNRNAEEKSNVKEEEKIKFPFVIIEFPENRNTSNNIIITTNEKKSKLHFSLETPVNIYGDMDAIKKINTKLSLNATHINK